MVLTISLVAPCTQPWNVTNRPEKKSRQPSLWTTSRILRIKLSRNCSRSLRDIKIYRVSVLKRLRMTDWGKGTVRTDMYRRLSVSREQPRLLALTPPSTPACPHRFSFKGLNPENRDQQCSFLLSTTNDDFYLVEQCEPPIPEEELGILIDDLNNSEDLGRFFQRIRRLWTETVLSVQGGSSP